MCLLLLNSMTISYGNTYLLSTSKDSDNLEKICEIALQYEIDKF